MQYSNEAIRQLDLARPERGRFKPHTFSDAAVFEQSKIRPGVPIDHHFPATLFSASRSDLLGRFPRHGRSRRVLLRSGQAGPQASVATPRARRESTEILRRDAPKHPDSWRGMPKSFPSGRTISRKPTERVRLSPVGGGTPSNYDRGPFVPAAVIVKGRSMSSGFRGDCVR